MICAACDFYWGRAIFLSASSIGRPSATRPGIYRRRGSARRDSYFLKWKSLPLLTIFHRARWRHTTAAILAKARCLVSDQSPHDAMLSDNDLRYREWHIEKHLNWRLAFSVRNGDIDMLMAIGYFARKRAKIIGDNTSNDAGCSSIADGWLIEAMSIMKAHASKALQAGITKASSWKRRHSDSVYLALIRCSNDGRRWR